MAKTATSLWMVKKVIFELQPQWLIAEIGYICFNPNKGDVLVALPGAGGGLGTHPIFLCSGATKRSKIMFPHNFGSFPTDLRLFQNFFSANHKKIAKIESILKIAKK